MELELKLEWLEAVAEKSGGLAPPDFVTLTQFILTSLLTPSMTLAGLAEN